MAQPYENKTIDDVLELWLFSRICGWMKPDFEV